MIVLFALFNDKITGKISLFVGLCKVSDLLVANRNTALFDVSLGDDLEVNVSGIDDLVEDYLMGEPDDYYEEYRDWKADNLEIEYIFER